MCNFLFERKVAKSLRLFFEHGMHRKNENPFVHLVSSVFMFILTTDFQDLTDANHERKRDNPFNLCYLWSNKITTDIQDLTDANHERKRANQIHQINPFLFSFSNTECTKETKAFFSEAQQAKASRLFCVSVFRLKSLRLSAFAFS